MTKLDEYLRMRAAAECRGVCRSTLCSWKVASKIPIETLKEEIVTMLEEVTG